jgi:hypothetical protein
MKYKYIINSIFFYSLIIILSILPMIMYRYLSFINILPVFEVCISYFLYKRKFNIIIILIYLLLINFLYSNFILSNILSFLISINLINYFEENNNFITDLIKMSIYTFIFLLFRYLLICLSELDLYNFIYCIAQILITIFVYFVITSILKIIKVNL